MMLSRILLISLLLLLIFNVTRCEEGEYAENCNQIEDDGYYCSPDLTGYTDCVYQDSSMYLGLRGTHKCPNGTRCSCYIDDWCKHENQERRKTQEGICVPYQTPAPFAESFAFTYKYHEHHESLNPRWEKSFKINRQGKVIRDKESGRYLWKEGHLSQLVIGSQSNTFTKHEINSNDRSCRKSNVNELPQYTKYITAKYFYVLYNIRHYTLLSSKPRGLNIQQTWFFQTGRNSWAYDFRKKWLTVLYDPRTNTISPLKYYEEYIGGEMAEHHVFTTIRYYPMKEEVIKKRVWSTIPSYCN